MFLQQVAEAKYGMIFRRFFLVWSVQFLNPPMQYQVHTISFYTFFVWELLLIVHIWNSSPLRSNLFRLQCTGCTVPTTYGRPHGSPLVWACQWPSSQPLSSPQLSHNGFPSAEGITNCHREQGLDYRDGGELSWCPSWSNSLLQGWNCELVHCPGGNATDPIWRVLASSDGISSLKTQHSNLNPNPKLNFIAYRFSKVSDCIFEIHQLWQSGFSRVYSNSCCSC